MSDAAVEQQPEHKEEIVAVNGDDAVKPEVMAEANGDVANDAAAEPASEKNPGPETLKKEAAKEKLSFSMSITLKGIKAKFPSVNQLSTTDLQTLLDEPTSNLILLDVRPEEEYVISHLEGSTRVDPETTDMEQILNIINNLKLEGGEPQVVFYCSVGYRSSRLANRLQQYIKKQNAPIKEEKVTEKKEEKPAEEKAAEEKKPEEENAEKPAEQAEEKKDEPEKAADEKTEEKKEEKAEEKEEKPAPKIPAFKISNLEGSLFKWANEDRAMVDNEGAETKLVHHYNKIFGKCLRKDLRYKPAKVVPQKEEKTEEKKDEKAEEKKEEKPEEKKEENGVSKENDAEKKEETKEVAATNGTEEVEHSAPAPEVAAAA